MKAYLAKNFMGVFAYDENGRLIEKMLFPPSSEEIAERMTVRSPEEGQLISKLKDYQVDRSPGNKGEKMLSEQSRNLALKFKWVKSSAEYNKLLSSVNVMITKKKMSKTKYDRILMQAIGMLDEDDRVINVLTERLREWYGLYFPEAERLVSNHEKFAELVLEGTRDGLEDKTLSKLANGTAGMDFSDDDIKQMQNTARSIKALMFSRREIERYVEGLSIKVAPNMTALAGPLLMSRLLVLAGGLGRMARMPSSSIQLLGAEKALFRHLKGQGKAPKYGILFSHPLVQKAPKDKKGKVARLLSAKLSLAAKTDFFSKEDHGKELKEKLEKQVKASV